MVICPYCKERLASSKAQKFIRHVCKDGFAYYILKKETGSKKSKSP